MPPSIVTHSLTHQLNPRAPRSVRRASRERHMCARAAGPCASAPAPPPAAIGAHRPIAALHFERFPFSMSRSIWSVLMHRCFFKNDFMLYEGYLELGFWGVFRVVKCLFSRSVGCARSTSETRRLQRKRGCSNSLTVASGRAVIAAHMYGTHVHAPCIRFVIDNLLTRYRL